MKILITGNMGYVGTAVAKYLRASRLTLSYMALTMPISHIA